MVQVRSTISTINPNTLRPVFHRFLHARQRTMNVKDLYRLGVPAFVSSTLDKIMTISENASPCTDAPSLIYLHRMVPLEPTAPKVVGVAWGMLCVARENVTGGDIITNESFTEPLPGDLVLFGDSSYYLRHLQPVDHFQEAYMDVLWFMRSP